MSVTPVLRSCEACFVCDLVEVAVAYEIHFCIEMLWALGAPEQFPQVGQYGFCSQGTADKDQLWSCVGHCMTTGVETTVVSISLGLVMFWQP